MSNPPWLFRFSILLSIAFLLVMVLGVVVTDQFSMALSSASGSVVFAIHRHAAETLGLLVVILAVWVTVGGGGRSGQSMAKRFAWCAVPGVIIEALLGRVSGPRTSAM